MTYITEVNLTIRGVPCTPAEALAHVTKRIQEVWGNKSEVVEEVEGETQKSQGA